MNIQVPPLISFIVPIFNGEKHVVKCVNSIIEQGIKDFEILLINDGSTDNTLNICNSIKEKETNISVFHKKNEGVSSARNIGIERAKGKWIFFVDVDDLLELNFLNQSIEILKGQKYDLLQFGVKRIKNDGIDTWLPSKSIEYISDFDVYDKRRCFRGELWNYIFRNDIIQDNKIKFSPTLKYAEDQEFVFKYFMYVKSILLLPWVGYNYSFIGGSAIFNKVKPIVLENNLISISNTVDYYTQHNIKMYSVINKGLNNLVFYYLLHLSKEGYSYSEQKEIILNYRKFYRKYNSIFYGKNRFLFFIAYRLPYIYKLRLFLLK